MARIPRRGTPEELSKKQRLRRGVYDDLTAAIEAVAMTYQAVELRSDAEVRALIGDKAAGLSGTFIANLRRKAVRSMKRKEMESVADWIVSRVSGQFPNVGVVPKRGRMIQVYLDGVPEVIE